MFVNHINRAVANCVKHTSVKRAFHAPVAVSLQVPLGRSMPPAYVPEDPLTPISDTFPSRPGFPMVPVFPPNHIDDEPLQAIKREYQPSVIRKKRKHGFLSRLKSVGGRRVINRRRSKGRKHIGA